MLERWLSVARPLRGAGSGYIDYDEFFAAMVRLNFVGVQREIEALFDRYDENCDGTLDYKVGTH